MLASTVLLALLAAAAPAGTPVVPASHTLAGEILSIDVRNRQVVVVQGLEASGNKGIRKRETLTVHVPFTTRVVRGKKAATLNDLKLRDHAVVRYQITRTGAEALSLQVADLATPTPAPSPDSPLAGAGDS